MECVLTQKVLKPTKQPKNPKTHKPRSADKRDGNRRSPPPVGAWRPGAEGGKRASPTVWCFFLLHFDGRLRGGRRFRGRRTRRRQLERAIRSRPAVVAEALVRVGAHLSGMRRARRAFTHNGQQERESEKYNTTKKRTRM